MNEEQPTLAANSLAPRGPPLRIHRVFSACYQRSHRRPSRDRPAENMSSDVEHVPVIGRLPDGQPLRLDGSLDSRETGRMPLGWKLVIDSTNAPALADFWAAALEYEVEDPSVLVSQLLAAGHIGSEAVVEYRGRRIFRGYAAIRHPEDPFDETSGIGRGRRLLFQEVSERSPARTACTSTSTVSPGASMSWLPGWRSWGQPAYARSMRDLQDAGGSCKTPKGMSSARHKPGRWA